MVVFFNKILRLCVENIFDENTKYCRFLMHVLHVSSILNMLCTKADDDDDVF